MQTDAELVKSCLDGEKQAFAELVKRYERPVRAVVLNVLGAHDSLPDVCQDAFVKAYESLNSLRKPKAFGPWIIKIAQRCALNAAIRRDKELTLDTGDEPVVDGFGVRLDDERQKLLSAVMKLPKGEKQVVILRYFSGHSVTEVAEILSRGVGTVTKQLSRAHKRLRDLLERLEK